MNAPDVAFQVARQFAALRRRYLLVRAGTALLSALGILLLAWLALAIIDYHYEWSGSWRRTTIATAIGLTAIYLVWRLITIVRISRRRPFAGIIERSFEEFGQRIRTVLDTVDGRVRGPEEMLTALGNQTLGRWESTTPSRIIPTAVLWGSVAVVAVLAAISLGCFGAGGDMRLALLRTLGIDQPYTTLEVSPGDVRLLEGTPINLSLDLVGRTDREVMVRYREVSSNSEEVDWIESELVADSDQDPSARRRSFQTGLGKAVRPIEYQFIAADQQSKIHRIDVQPLIETKRIEIQVQPPSYTGLQTRLFSKSDLTVLERSEVLVTIELNHPLENAVLEIGPKLSKLDQVELPEPQDRTQWQFNLPSDKNLRWRFSGAGDDGTPMESLTGRLGIRRDSAPTLRWREPTDEIKVHTLAEVPLGVQVADDYGIIEAGIAFQLGGDEEYVLKDWLAEDGETDSTEAKTRLLLSELFPLESFELTERDYIAYYAYAIDNRPWGNHRTESDVRYIDIRPLRQFYQEIDLPDNNNDGPQRVLIRLDEIIRRERFVINRTRKLVRDGLGLAEQLGTIDRLVENQSELADLTRFLAEFFISRGNDDVAALSQAEATMLQAADSLAAGSLDLALAQERESLLSLAEARRTLEIALTKRMTQAQRQALRRLARQLQQKLRRDPPETERQIADSLKQIAAQQRRIAAMAQSAMAQSAKAQSAKASSQPSSSNAPGGTPNSQDAETTDPQPSASNPKTDEPNTEEQLDSDSPDTQPEEGGNEDQNDNESDSEMVADNDSAQANETEQIDEAEQSEKLFEEQLDLLERIEAIREQLAERLADSELLAQRMEEAESEMDTLATNAREGEFEKLAQGSAKTSDLVEEMGVQLEAISAMEPVTRVSSLRDLTGSLASMEHEVTNARDKEPTSGGDQQATDFKRLADRLAERSKTLEDVIGAQADIGDIEMSEVNDQLSQFAEQQEFLEKLQATKDAADTLREVETSVSAEMASEAMDRAVDYVEAASELERLYQQLVTPRLARLRSMEQRASRLASSMGKGGGPQDPETERELNQLQKDLREESLRELAEMLEEGGAQEELQEAPSGQQGSEERIMRSQGSQLGSGIALDNRGTASGRVRLVADELRKRIQQVILLEIAVDRDTPIPNEYRRAVDGYFKTLATNGETDSGVNQSGGGQ